MTKITQNLYKIRSLTMKELANFIRKEFAGLKNGSLESMRKYLQNNNGFTFFNQESNETFANALNFLQKNKEIDFEVVALGDTELFIRINFKFKK